VRALIYIIQALSMLVTFVFLLRFWLPWVGADFRNALAQGILQITSPVINPIRRVVPSIGRIDTATVLVLFAIQAITFLLIGALSGAQITAKYILILSAIGLAQQSIRIFMFAIIIRIVLSWVAPHVYNAATALIANLTDPVLRPFRRLIPPIGGIDISPVFAIIALGALDILVTDLAGLAF
jgi:YggT family protein